MFSATSGLLTRPAVAMFNMKHFQSKYKVVLNAENFTKAFSENLLPKDRLLRHSVAGGGSTRVLVLDHAQKVKGVYHPLLCLPHPVTVSGGLNVLGLPVEDYVKAITPSEGMPLPSVMVMVSHPNGIAFGTFRADGSVGLPVKNFSFPNAVAEGSKGTTIVGSTNPVLGDSLDPALLEEMLDALSSDYEEYLDQCSTFYFVTRDKNTSISLGALRRAEKEGADDEEEAGAVDETGDDKSLFFSDPRWIHVPDVMLQDSMKGVSLYERGTESSDKVVSGAGLLAAITRGKLLLDHIPKGQKPSPPHAS